MGRNRNDPGAEPRVAKEGFALLVAPKDVTACSVDGTEYQADDAGVVEVSGEHVAELADRGFKAVDA